MQAGMAPKPQTPAPTPPTSSFAKKVEFEGGLNSWHLRKLIRCGGRAPIKERLVSYKIELRANSFQLTPVNELGVFDSIFHSHIVLI